MPDDLLSKLSLPPNAKTSLVTALSQARDLIRRETDAFWRETAFSEKKAFVAAVFSQIAYLHIPGNELRGKRQVKVIPCDGWRESVQSGRHADIRQMLLQGELGEPVIVGGESLVAVGAMTEKVTFVAFRGTHNLFVDLPRDLNALPHRLNPPHDDFQFHSGFVSSLADCVNPLAEQLAGSRYRDAPVYVTGHSLGAAAAAIMHAFWPMRVHAAEIGPPKGEQSTLKPTHCAYTFAMPRYGNAAAMQSLRQPYHVFRRDDPIPFAPPVRLGYANTRFDYESLEDAIRPVSSRGTRKAMQWWAGFLPGLALRLPTHRMESYLERVSRAAGF